MEFTKREYQQFYHGISMSLLSKESAQKWRYDDKTAEEIRFLKGLESKVLDKINQADTPQTDCDTCRHYKLACELFSEVCKYEPITQTETQNSNNDAPQTDLSAEEFVEGMKNLKMEVKRTDCSWK